MSETWTGITEKNRVEIHVSHQPVSIMAAVLQEEAKFEYHCQLTGI